MQVRNQKTPGFTLIELLVVIVIIGILSTISTATFRNYFAKARDAERQATVQNISLMVKVDSSDTWQDDKFYYDSDLDGASPWDAGSLEELFGNNDYRTPTGKNNICYYFGSAHGTNTSTGDDNEFFILTWGETTSSKVHGTAGAVYDGTEVPVIFFDTGPASLGAGAVACDSTTAWATLRTAIKAATGWDGTDIFLRIDADGTISDVSV